MYNESQMNAAESKSIPIVVCLRKGKCISTTCNWMGNIHFRCQLHCVGKHQEIQFKYKHMTLKGHLVTFRFNKQVTTIVCSELRSSGILTGNISLHNTFFAPVRANSTVKKTNCCNWQSKIEIFLTWRQLCKHSRVSLERLLYSFRCLELRHCTGSKLSKKQTRQKVTTEVYNMLLPILGPSLLAGRSKCSRLARVSSTQVSYVTQIKRKRQCT